jgi:hypothetical protein
VLPLDDGSVNVRAHPKQTFAIIGSTQFAASRIGRAGIGSRRIADQ